MFSAMMEGIKEESVGSLFNLQVEVQEDPIVEEAAGAAAPTGAHAKPGGPGGAHAKPAPIGNGQAAAQPAAGQAARAQQAQPGRSRRSRAAGGGRAAAPQAGGPAPASPADEGPVVAPGLQRPKRPAQLQYSAPSADGPGQVEQRSDKSSSGDAFARVGRNDMCPCGSGRKYKRCHGDPRNRTDG
jgi:preprotein translocase subunit SecA